MSTFRERLAAFLTHEGFTSEYVDLVVPDLVDDGANGATWPAWHWPSVAFLDPEENAILDQDVPAQSFPIAARMRRLAVARDRLDDTAKDARDVLTAEINRLRPEAIAERRGK